MKIEIFIILFIALSALLILFYLKKVHNGGAPDFFPKEQFEEFEKLILEYFENKGQKAVIKGSSLNIVGIEYAEYGLSNLAEKCKLAETKDWREIIKEHFNGLEKAALFRDEFENIEKNFDEVKKHIAVTIYPNDYFRAC